MFACKRFINENKIIQVTFKIIKCSRNDHQQSQSTGHDWFKTKKKYFVDRLLYYLNTIYFTAHLKI